MAELRLPGRAGEKVVGPAGRRRGGTWVVWPLPAGLFEMASCAWNSVRSSQMVIACSTWHRVCNYCWLQPLLFFFASVWPVWMFRMLLLCSITPCPDSGLLEGGKNEEGNRVLTVSPFGLYTKLLCIDGLQLVFLIQ